MNENIGWSLVIVFAAKEIVTLIIKSFFSKSDKMSSTMEEHVKILVSLTTKFENMVRDSQGLEKDIKELSAKLTEFTVKVSILMEATEDLPKIRKDLNEAHAKIRAYSNTK